MFGVMQHLSVELCDDAEEAVAKGYDYKKMDIKPVNVVRTVVVKNGTRAGNATVDFIMEDEAGNRYVFMVTGSLLKALPV